MSNLQYRLGEVDGLTRITLRHQVFGLIPDDFRKGLSEGWRPLLERVRTRAEAA